MATSHSTDLVLPPIQIDPEFAAMIPPLADDERQQLEANIKRDGCRDALVTWNGVLLDGHNRFEICERLGLGYRTKEIALADRDAAADWIDTNQLGRRNLTPEQASLLRGRRYNRQKKSEGGRSDREFGADKMSTPTAERLAEQHGVTERTIRRDGDFAEAVEDLKPFVPDIEQRIMSGDVPSKSAVMEAAKEPERAAEILSKPHVSHNSGNNEWYTPAEYVEAARTVLSQIDLDPASCLAANEVIKAKRFFTSEKSGLDQKWKGRVWMNPPYAQPLCAQFADKMAESVAAGDVKAAVVLVNNATETQWFRALVDVSSAMCFPTGRVRFWSPGRDSAAPLQGQALIYIGEDVKSFIAEFQPFGFVVTVSK